VRFVVLGDPIDHSLSPAIHNAAFDAAGLLGTYERRRVDAAGLAAAAEEVRRGELAGANVTMPHKEAAAHLCDRLAPSAASAGVVNTWVRSGGQVVGHNTDVSGIRAAWREAGLAEDAPVLVLGAGGAAAAALVALSGHSVRLAARRPDAARFLVSRVHSDARPVAWGTSADGAVVVNATPLGMHGESLPTSLIEEAVGLFEMAYATNPTPAVDAARLRGLPVAEGRRMLLHQAAAAFELWTGHAAPLDAMDAALRG